MFDGQLLYGESEDEATVVFSPWMERGANNALFTFEVIAVSGSGTLTVKVFHKNTEDTGDGASAGTIGTRTSKGTTTTAITALKELVRYEFSSGGGALQWAMFRTLSPAWYDEVVAS